FDEREAALEGVCDVFHDDAPLERKGRKNKKGRERMPKHAPATGVVKRRKTRKPESREENKVGEHPAPPCLDGSRMLPLLCCHPTSSLRGPADGNLRRGNPHGGSVFRNAGTGHEAVWIATGLRPSQ
ncbi:MAG: hypothetical protein LBO79_08670, partial [Zoogloeaceae bacterium]|nr:hypothetical protein [Zoogloeaceae bacterium]